VAGGAEVKKNIAEHSNAIGYIERSQVDSSVKVLHSQYLVRLAYRNSF
jgi:ABC-type phosphate transport system substrate-binding protein